MPLTHDQLDSFLENFRRFATEKINNGGAELTVNELLQLWAFENPTAEERAEVAEIIRQGDEDIAAGRGRPVDKVNEELRQKYNLSAE